jgi:2-C-methyl-D-erythritol 4-phosphate cytidylyltransferase
MGGGHSKIFLNIAGRPIIQRSVETLQACERLAALVVLARSEDLPALRGLGYPSDRVRVALGGESRQESVLRGLEFLKEEFAPQERDFVLVHDAARCLLSSGLVERTLTAALLHLAVTTAVPVVDSIKKIRADGSVECSLARERLVAIQTPQVFRFDLLWKAHHSGQTGATDDAGLVELIQSVMVVPGESHNLKITSPQDIHAAEAWLAAQAENSISRPS